MVTIDTAECRTAIMRTLREARADFLLAVKGNQHTLHRDVMAAFAKTERGPGLPEAWDRCEGRESKGGRPQWSSCAVAGVPACAAAMAPPLREACDGPA